MSLVDLARAIPSNQRRQNKIDGEQIELAIAWLKDQVSMKQVCKARGKLDSYSWLVTTLREAYRTGVIEEVG